jgi:hypothetical protein
MDSIAEENAIRAGEAPAAAAVIPGAQSVSLPIVLTVLSLAIVVGGGAVRRHLGGEICSTAYAAALLAALSLPLLLLGAIRQRKRGRTRLLLGLSVEHWSWLAVFIFFLAFYSITRAGPTPFYEPSVQAVAFLHGHSWVDAPGHMEQVGPLCTANLPIAKRLPECDFTRFHNRTFLVHPPLAAIVMMPFVAAHGRVVDGSDEYQPTVCALLGAIEVALVWHLLLLLGLSTSARIWLTAFLGIGTTLWYEATLGASWDFVLVVSILPTLLALNELFGKGRPWLVGIFAGLAALGRNDLVMAWPFYALLLLVRGKRIRDLFWMGPGFGTAAAVYGAFNYTRYGTFFDQSLWLWYRCCDGGGFQANPTIPGPFSIHYLPAGVYTLLFLGWGFNGTAFPWVRPQGAGQALLLTSPAFILTLRASFKRWETILMWLAAALTMSASLLVYAPGFVQFGTRYYVQIFPFLLVLMALGVGKEKALDQMTGILIVASILMVAFGLWQIRTIGFG